MRVQGRRSVTDNDVLPRWRHTRSFGQSVAGRAPRWSGPSRMNMRLDE